MLVFLRCVVLDLTVQHLSDTLCDIATLTCEAVTLEVMALVSGTGFRVTVFHLCTKFEVCKPSHFEDTLSVSALVGLVTLPLTC